MKRVEVNDPIAIRQMGVRRYHEGDYNGAFEYLSKAAELGEVGSHYELSNLYSLGQGVERNKKKQLHHLEEAAIGGHPTARFNLGATEWNNCRMERAVKHWIIAASLGSDASVGWLKEGFKRRVISKEDCAAALRAHQATADDAKSPQRDEARKALRLPAVP